MRSTSPKLLVLLINLFFTWMWAKSATVRPSSCFQETYKSDNRKVPASTTVEPFDFPTHTSRPWDNQPSSNAANGGVDSSHGESRQPRISSSDFNSPDVQHVGHCKVQYTVDVNCSARDLNNIPNTEFPIGIMFYDLSRNHIAALPRFAFSRYLLLRELNLQQNIISIIDPFAFVGLSNLESLDLYKNKLIMNATTLINAFSENVFCPLKNLRKLRLEGNNPQPSNKGLRYPHKALSHLGSLEHLNLDGFFNAVFESGFANLTKLTNLSLEGYKYGKCTLTALKNETFQYLTPLQHLSINDCNLQGHLIEAGSFSPLKRLISLHIDHNQDINVQFLDRVLFGLQNTTTLRSLYMQYVVNQYTLSVCLSSEYIQYFPQSVKYLDVKGNKLECIDRNVIDKIKNSLEKIDISRNSFVFGTYFKDLPKLKRLKMIVIDGKIIRASDLPRTYPHNPHTPHLETGNCSLYARKDQENEGDFTIQLPPNLKTIKIRYSKITYILSRLDIDSNNNLRYIRIEGNYIPYLKGPIIGLNKLKICQLSFNNVNRIYEHFFKTFPSLQMLNLSSNNLGGFFAINDKTTVFHPLVKLQTLDLALNTIRFLGRTTFYGMTELRYLRISHNPIYRFDSDLSQTNKLQAFIAVDTSLSLLPKETRDIISLRIKKGFSFRVELDQSPILCDCPNLPFLDWMVTSGSFNFSSREYRCYFPDTSSMDIHDGYAKVLNKLSRHCSSHQYLFFATGAATAGFIIFILLSLAYRFRWKLRYMYHAAYIYVTSGRNDRSTNRFDHDVFVCYAEEDRHFVMNMLYPALESRGLSVFVHHRHFTAGELIGSNIVRAVNSCRRTLVVLTRTLAESSWCNYEIQMANMESAQRGEPVLIFLLLGGIKSNEMGNELLYNIQTNTYIPFPSESCANENVLNFLYDKLARDIKG